MVESSTFGKKFCYFAQHRPTDMKVKHRVIVLVTTVVILLAHPAKPDENKGRNIRSGQLQPFPGKTFRPPCPWYCKCRNRAMTCDGAKLEEIPRQMPRDLEYISLRNNRIRKLNDGQFRRMIDLRHLVLDGNRLSIIDEKAFDDLYYLKSLNLANNEITWLNQNVFRHLVMLKELILNKNLLRSAESLLNYLANAHILRLAENRLETITHRTFYGNSQVRLLDLHSNRIRFIHRHAFQRMTSLTFLILRDNPLTEVDVQFSFNHQLEQLDVTNCQLTSVVHDTPKQLRDLRLSENNISHIDDFDFLNPVGIQLLVLNDNSIDMLADAAFQQMSLLYDLHLSHNRLTSLPQSMPGDLHGLYASYNNITHLSAASLAKQYHLRHLVLSHNTISKIDPKAMRSLRFLVSLDLSYNTIERLQAAVFVYTTNLQRLDLSHNPIFVLDAGCFLGLHRLHILRMSSVEGSDLMRTNAFSDMEQLLFLDVSNSSRLAAKLTNGSQAGLSIYTVEDINLIGTGLRRLPSTFERNMPFLRVVKMTLNPWHCDPNIGWMIRWIREDRIQFYEPERMVCATPPPLLGRRISELSMGDLIRFNSRQFQKPPTTGSKGQKLPTKKRFPSDRKAEQETTA